MEESEILKTLNEIFIDVFENGAIILKYDTKTIDIDNWDSLNHIQMVVAVEKCFKIRFSSKEIPNWISVGDIINSISAKLNR